MIVRKERLGGFVYQVYGKRNGKKVYVRTYDNRKAALAADEDHRVTTRKIEAGELPPEVDSKRTIKQSIETWLDTLAEARLALDKTHGNYVRSYVLPHLGPGGRRSLDETAGARLARQADRHARAQDRQHHRRRAVVRVSLFRRRVRLGRDETLCHGVKPVEVPEGVYTWNGIAEEMTKKACRMPAAWRSQHRRGRARNRHAARRAPSPALGRRRHRSPTDHRASRSTRPSEERQSTMLSTLDTVLPLLRELRLKRDGAELVFPSPSTRTSKRDGAGKKKLAPRTKPSVQYPFKQAVAAVGLPKQLRFHDLRHTFASHWVLNGGDIFRLSKCLGHSSVVITQKFYAHLAPEACQRDYARISFVVPREDVAHGTTKRQSIVARENAELRAV